MSTFPIPDTFWGLDSERHQANERRAEQKGLEPCVACGRGVAEGKGWQVCATGGGGDLLAMADYEADPVAAAADRGFMGFWTIGPECGKAIPAAFKVRN